MDRTTHSTGTPWERAVSYSRAVRVGRHLFVSGTTASNADGTTVSPGDPYGQANFILHKIEGALRELRANTQARCEFHTPDSALRIRQPS